MRIKTWSNKQLLRRLAIVHRALDEAKAIIDEIVPRLKKYEQWEEEKAALVKKPTIEQIAEIVTGKPGFSPKIGGTP